jgi:hypothetical protein
MLVEAKVTLRDFRLLDLIATTTIDHWREDESPNALHLVTRLTTRYQRAQNPTLLNSCTAICAIPYALYISIIGRSQTAREGVVLHATEIVEPRQRAGRIITPLKLEAITSDKLLVAIYIEINVATQQR